MLHEAFERGVVLGDSSDLTKSDSFLAVSRHFISYSNVSKSWGACNGQPF